MDKVVITDAEVEAIAATVVADLRDARLPSPVPLSARLALLPLVLVLPVLSAASGVAWILVRHSEPRIRHAWIHFFFGLLIASSLLSTAGGLYLYLAREHPLNVPLSSEPFSLDTFADFSQFNNSAVLSTEELARKAQPLVLIVSQSGGRRLHSRDTLTRGGFGAGVLIYATDTEYLVVTARHVIGNSATGEKVPVWGATGGYAQAEVVGHHKSLDLSLLKISRKSGAGTFAQSIGSRDQSALGMRIVVCGHPQGMFYTIADGLISRIDGTSIIQISAPISPGASGGPVYDMRGRLVGIITSTVSKALHPQSENLNFAVRADSLLDPKEWQMSNNALLTKYVSSATSLETLSSEPMTGYPQPSSTSQKPTAAASP